MYYLYTVYDITIERQWENWKPRMESGKVNPLTSTTHSTLSPVLPLPFSFHFS